MIFDSFHTANDRMMQTYNGLMIGVVTNNKDPDKLGRVKVKLPIFDENMETEWIRIATLMGGKERGMLFIPEVNDEVLVAFVMADITNPIVIGSLWNGKDKPPAGNDDQNNFRIIRSREGHEIIFGDKKGDEKLTIHTKDGHKLEFTDKDDTIKLQDKDAKHMLTIKGTPGSVELKSSTTKITIDAKGEATIESKQKITLKSTMINIEASAQLKIEAGASLDLKSNGIINIKGSMVKIN